MAEIIQMPLMSDTMTEGVIVEWHKKVGDTIKSGDLVAEIETDKATMEFESIYDGILLYVAGEKGQAIKVGDLLAIIGKAGDDVGALVSSAKAAAASAAAPSPAAEAAPVAATPSAPTPVASSPAIADSSDGDRLKASPLARSIAKSEGISLQQVNGSGEGGRIVKRDIDDFIKRGPVAAPAAAHAPTFGSTTESYTDFPLSQMRKAIARRLSESKYTAPHYYLTMDIDMSRAAKLRTQLNVSAEVKISFNDIIVKAAALSLRKHPKVNASWVDGEKIRQFHYVHIGVAVAIEDGLIVPVVRNADNKGIAEIGTEVRLLATKAKNKELQPHEFSGSTFTISNLGMFGIDQFTAIINSPDACILAVGGIVETPVFFEKDGQKKIRAASMMKVTLSCDHRVVDGAVGSAFLQTLKDLLENPLKMLL
jgi:pyruvate dehydrogenase E2 component (dihydrolipoamide acetyltransferase)